MRALKPGTLVQLRKELFSEGEKYIFEDAVDSGNGVLWVVQDLEVERNLNGRIVRYLYTCKSLATGETQGFYRTEFVVAK